MNDQYMEIVRKANDRKDRMDLTNPMIAKKVGVHSNTVNRFFNGGNVGVIVMMSILEVLGMDVTVI